MRSGRQRLSKIQSWSLKAMFQVKRIGQNMSAGEIEINGNVDMHCGCDEGRRS